MTKERIAAIADALATDDAKRAELLEMTPEAAADALAAQGYDFSAEELGEFGKLVGDTLGDGELDALLGVLSDRCRRAGVREQHAQLDHLVALGDRAGAHGQYHGEYQQYSKQFLHDSFSFLLFHLLCADKIRQMA